MARCVRHPERLAEMGRRSRQLAVAGYDVREVNRHMLAAAGFRTHANSSAWAQRLATVSPKASSR